MDEFLKMDIFFVVATIGTLVLVGLFATSLWYVIKLLRTLERIAREVEEEAKALRVDLDEARASAKREGSAIVHFLRKTAMRLFSRKRTRRS